MKRVPFFFVILSFFSLAPLGMSATPAKEKPKKTIEMEAIEIRGKIQEPTLLYILDQPQFEIEPYEETVDFLNKIQEPVEDNQL